MFEPKDWGDCSLWQWFWHRHITQIDWAGVLLISLVTMFCVGLGVVGGLIVFAS